jgi:hypothetical protein
MRRFRVALLTVAVLLLFAGVVRAATLPPDNLTPTAPEPTWDGSQWGLLSSSDTVFGDSICVEFAVSSDGTCDLATLSDHTAYRGTYQSSGGQGSIWAFAVTPPGAFLDMTSPQAVCYQFFIDNYDDNCDGGALYTGYNWSFETGPNAVDLTSLLGRTPWGLALAVGAVACGGVVVWRRRSRP